MPERSGGKGVPDKLPKKYRGNHGKFKNIKIWGQKKTFFFKILNFFLNPRIFFKKISKSKNFSKSKFFQSQKKLSIYFSDRSQKN